MIRSKAKSTFKRREKRRSTPMRGKSCRKEKSEETKRRKKSGNNN
jgi:hypothetical protein